MYDLSLTYAKQKEPIFVYVPSHSSRSVNSRVSAYKDSFSPEAPGVDVSKTLTFLLGYLLSTSTFEQSSSYPYYNKFRT